MASTFDERMRELEGRVGSGRITGRVAFTPEKIAVPQERGTWFTGPNAGVQIRNYTTPGTGSGYLIDPLIERGEGYFRSIAREILTLGARVPMERAVNDLRAEALRRVPRKTTLEPGEAFHREVSADVSEDLVSVHG